MDKLLSLLIINRSNFEVLHWKVRGEDFDNMHANVTTKYYSMFNDDIDTIAEIGMRMGINPVNYLDAYRVIKNAVPNVVIADADRDYSRDEVVAITNKLLIDTLQMIESVLYTDEIHNNHSNVGIKATLESLYEKYDLECRFLNKSRM